MESHISLGGTIFYSLSLGKNTEYAPLVLTPLYENKPMETTVKNNNLN